jgi:xanthine dehydrogenase accessory factor
MTDWPHQALARVRDARPTALVTLLAVEGSVPREAGTKMLVWPGGQWGTIGGGNLEHQAATQARRMLALGEQARFAVQDYPLGPLLSQCCGGRVRLLIERLDGGDAGWLAEAAGHLDADRPYVITTRIVDGSASKSVTSPPAQRLEAHPVSLNGRPARARDPRPADGDLIVERSAPGRPSLSLFGAGHVGQAIARALEPLPFRLRWYDSRPEAGELPGVAVLPAQALAAIAAEPTPYALVLTHDHGLDYALVRAALAGGHDGYLGLIGSKTKRARFLGRLRAEGFCETALARLVCPIGLPQIRGKAPETIAVSVAADLLMRREASLRPCVREMVIAGL